MKRLLAWMLIGSALSLVGCATSAPNCAGWKKIGVKPDTAVYLAGNDITAGQGIAAHNAYGKKAGCWK